MTQLPSLVTFKEEFERKARQRESERLNKERNLAEREKRKEDQEERAERDDLDMVVAVMASSDDIGFALTTCDAYDVATVEALIANREVLEKAEEDVRIMLDRAYVLPDGRRVFKTEDGTRIFDEHGEEIADFDPKTIEDWRPRWEAFSERTERHDALTEQREQILAYQEKLDAAREQLNAGEITKDDLDRMMKDLRDDMPEAVRAHLPEEAAPESEPEPPAKPDSMAAFRPDPAAKLDMPTL